MTNSTSVTDPPADSQTAPFRLDDRVAGGMLMADEVHEWMTWLRVRSDERLAMLVLNRHNGDLVGRPVGLFRRRLDQRELAELQRTIEAVQWTKLPAPTRGDVTASQITIEYQRGDLLIQREFNARNMEFIAAIQPLMDAMTELMRSIMDKPAAVVQVSVGVTPDPADRNRRSLGLVIENPGSAAIVLTDPRVPAPAGAASPRMYLRVAPASTGWSEPSWTSLPLPSLPEGLPTTLVLPAGGKLEFAVPWQAPGPGSYIVQGAWIDYGGPAEPVVDQLAAMPLPEFGPAPAMAGPYPVRGAAFATGVSFDVQPT